MELKAFSHEVAQPSRRAIGSMTLYLAIGGASDELCVCGTRLAARRGAAIAVAVAGSEDA
jgi:hypothetical protein